MNTRTCAECGNAFVTRTEHQRFCSSKCRTRHHRVDTRSTPDRVRADVAVRVRTVERALTALADAAVELDVDGWTQTWASVAQFMRAEIARVARGKS